MSALAFWTVLMKMNKAIDKRIYDGKKNVAVVLIRGLVRTEAAIRDTLKMLNIERKHCCTVVRNTKSNMGMINRLKDYVTFGEVDEETLKLLIEKRGQKAGDKLKPFFRLSPPRGGFERKGIKVSFNRGGVLGYRGKHINISG